MSTLEIHNLRQGIEFAATNEKESENLYINMARKLSDKFEYTGQKTASERLTSKMLEYFAAEEARHYSKLQELKHSFSDEQLAQQFEHTFVAELPPEAEMKAASDEELSDFDLVVKYAARQEQNAYKLYTGLAEKAKKAGLEEASKLFKDIALDEAEHQMQISMAAGM